MGNRPVIPERRPKGFPHKKKNRKRKRKDDSDPLIEAKRTKNNVGGSTKLNKKKDIFNELAKPENFEAYIAVLNILLTKK